jgi:hypothetical protein
MVLSPTGLINLGFITKGRLAAVLITPSLGVPNWSVIYINTAPSTSFLAPDTSKMYLLSRTLLLLSYPLICVFCMQLTRTNAIFSRIALVSRFCAEIQLSVKIRENIVKILFH